MKSKLRNKMFWRLKNVIIVTFVFIILTNQIGYDLKYEFLDIHLAKWIIGYLLSLVLAIFLHWIIFKSVIYKNSKCLIEKKNKEIPSEFKNKLNTILDLLKTLPRLIASPDYFYADFYKKRLLGYGEGRKSWCKQKDLCIEVWDKDSYIRHHQKNLRRDFIIYSNWVNVVIACVICMAAVNIQKNEIFLTFLFFHTVSRVIEVVWAFYQDVVRAKMDPLTLGIGYKSSNLKRGNRISLALHSYVEFILLFACIYFLSGDYINNNFLNYDVHSFLDFFLYSMSVSAFNFSLDIQGTTTFGRTIHVVQVITNMTLIVLSVATYIGMKDKMSEIEKSEWNND